jgi:hypothetical protein
MQTSENFPSRNCLIIPNGHHSGLPPVVRMPVNASFRRPEYRQGSKIESPGDLSDSFYRSRASSDSLPLHSYVSYRVQTIASCVSALWSRRGTRPD